ncbi:MAG: porin [Verrucomicrobiales bacterium]|jgi:hypothetical protein|nr:porin [Verrucomicrobiales bacterium]
MNRTDLIHHLMVLSYGMTLVSSSVMAETTMPVSSTQDLSAAIEKINYIATKNTDLRLSGYVDAGYIYNFTGNDQVANRFPTDGQRAGDFNLNAVKLTFDKPLTYDNELQAGFRTDLMLGEDAGKGNQASAFSMEQAYVIFRLPLGNGLDVRIGKFASWLGYETMERPGNVNITYSQMYTFLPVTMTGVSFTYPINDRADMGWAVGNGVKADNVGSFDSDDGYGIMAMVKYRPPGDRSYWQNSVYYSWDSAYELANGQGHNNSNAVIYDSLFNWVPQFAGNMLLLGASVDLGYAENSDSGDGVLNNTSSTLWGLAVYTKYQLTAIFSLAGRIAYLHTNDPGAFYGNTSSGWLNTGTQDTWSFTLTSRFDLAENLSLRVEYRADLGNDSTYYTNGVNTYTGNGMAQTIALEAVYSF